MSDNKLPTISLKAYDEIITILSIYLEYCPHAQKFIKEELFKMTENKDADKSIPISELEKLIEKWGTDYFGMKELQELLKGVRCM